jgi:hypothetical protein
VGRPALKREVVVYIIDHYGLALARACKLIRQVRSTQYVRSRKEPKLALRQRLRELAHVRTRWGYRRLHILLKREGWQVGRNQTYRLCCLEQLQLRSYRHKRRKMAVTRELRHAVTRPNQAWSMDFVADQMADGSKFRMLTILDIYTREALAIEVGLACAASMWWPHGTGWSSAGAHPPICGSTMAASFPATCWTCGPITKKRKSISAGPASRPTTALLNRSTGHCATSASTFIGSRP